MSPEIDINCDMGESGAGFETGNDPLIMPYISSVNIACGFHAGDPETILETIRLALKRGVAVGAHPGYHDREGFGRRAVEMAPGALRAALLYQVGALMTIARTLGVKLAHVKPHGALYNSAARDPGLALTVALAVRDVDPDLMLVGLPESALEEAAAKSGLRFLGEFFADRAYNDDGTLLPRTFPGAVIHDPETMAERVLEMIFSGRVESVSGRQIAIRAETVCIHGDNQAAPQFVKLLFEKLENRGVAVRAPSTSGAV